MESKIQRLVEWGVSNGAIIDGCFNFKYTEDHGVHAIASSTQEQFAGGPQIQIPIDLIIRSCLAEDYFNVKIESLPNPNGLLKLLLAHFKFNSQNHVITNNKNLSELFEPYIDLLPIGRETNSVYYWYEDEVQLLDKTNLGGSLMPKLKSIEKEWRAMLDLLPDSFKTGAYETDIAKNYVFSHSSNQLTNELLKIESWTSFSAYLWSSIIFASRAFPHHIISSEAVDGQAILIPIIDLLNHDNTVSVDWSFNLTPDGQYFTLQSNEPLLKGHEIFNNYGAKSNEELLMGYGFVVENNRNDSVALKYQLPIEFLGKAKDFGVIFPKIEDYTYSAFAMNPNHINVRSPKIEDLNDGLLYFINRSTPIPDNLLHLFSFLTRSRQESQRTLRSNLSALQNLRNALEQKKKLLGEIDLNAKKYGIDQHIWKMAQTYRNGQKEIYKLSLSEIKRREKNYLLDYKGLFLTLKKIYKRDQRLLDVLHSIGFDSYEKIEVNNYCDIVLFMWLILNAEVPSKVDDFYIAPKWLTDRYKEIQLSEFSHDDTLKPVYNSLSSVLQDTPLKPFITERNISISSEVIKQNSYVRISSQEIILVKPFAI